MSDTKHTPGPWTCSLHSELPERTHEVVTAGESVADVTGEANARLIAAAPDLLAALDACAEMLGDSYNELGYACAPRCYRDAREAIAKARGQ